MTLMHVATGDSSQHFMTKHIQRQIDLLKQKILDLGSLVEDAIGKAISALNNRDASLADSIIANDDVIDHLEIEVEEECLKILALYQPVAADLRFVVAALKINNDLERMGDIARNIAKRAGWLARRDPLELPVNLRQISLKSQQMVRQSLDAFVNADSALARKVRSDDDNVDAARRQIRDHVLAQMRRHPDRLEELVRVDSVSKHFERLADMATNIADDVVYMVEGEIVRHSSDAD